MRVVHSRLRRTSVVLGVGGIIVALIATTPLLPAEAQTSSSAPTVTVSAATAPVTVAVAERSAGALDAALAQRGAERAAEIEAARVAAEAEAARVAAEAVRVAAEAEAARIAAERAARVAAAQAALGSCASADVAAGYPNGKIPESALCTLPGTGGFKLRSDAALAFVALNEAYQGAFGERLPVGDTYRSYSAQVAAKAQKGRMVATPGTSNHGEGIAIDFSGGISGFGTAEHEWMRANAPAYGWNLPGWAREGGSKPEPWHWEYQG